MKAGGKPQGGWLVGDLLQRCARRLPRKTAVICDGARLTYAELDRQSNALGNALLDLAVKPGDKVAVLSRNSAEFIAIHYGLAKIAAVMVPLNFRYTAQELAFILNDSGAETVIFQQEFADVIAACRPRLGRVRNYVGIGSARDFALDYRELIGNHPHAAPAVAVEEDAECYVLYTSGTTGTPKGAIITHKAGVATSLSVTIDLCVEEADVILVSAPLFHAGSINLSLHPAATVGATLVLMKKFDPDEALYWIETEKITRIGIVPTMLYQLLATPAFERSNIGSVTRINYGASPMPRQLLENALERFRDVKMTQSYGSSECGQLTVLKPQDQIRKFGCTGKPLVGVDVAVLDPQFREVSTGEIGEIVTRGPHVMSGYLNRPAETHEAFRSGWCHTGDMAVVDEEGFITIVDRKTDLIISGGENIYPKEVESVICSHPAVLEAAVFGIPDEQWVESVCAAVVVRPGMEISDIDVIDHCRKHLASYKKPRVVTFHGSLPKNDWGKVLKNALKAPYWRGTGRRI